MIPDHLRQQYMRKKVDKIFSDLAERFRRSWKDHEHQLDLRVDHGDICGDGYSRAMFEAQQQDSTS